VWPHYQSVCKYDTLHSRWLFCLANISITSIVYYELCSNSSIICSMHFDYDLLHIQPNAHKLYNITYYVCMCIYELSVQIENFSTRCFYVCNHIPYKQWHISEFYSSICQHHTIYNMCIFIVIAANTDFLHCI
jgi:hypothetical protein